MSFTSTSPRNRKRARTLAAHALAFFGFTFAALACAPPATATAAVAACPHALYLASTNGHYYVAVFSAPIAMKASLDITVYAKSNAYGASLTQLSLEKPWKTSDAESGFRAYTTVLANPGTEPLLAAAIRPFGLADGSICPAEERLIPSVADVIAPPHPPSQAVVALEKEFAAEAGDGSNALPMTQIPLPPNSSCAVPFAPAKLLTAVSPDLATTPHAAPLQATVDVSLSATGAVTGAAIKTSSGDAAYDRAVIDAARKSRYAAPVFHCVAEAGHYLVVAGVGTPETAPAPTAKPSP